MEDKQQKSTGIFSSAAPFILGLLLALTFGWWIFPSLIYSEKHQPVAFTHATHVDAMGMECTDCHDFRADGSWGGFPTNEVCESCHAEAQGTSEAEAVYIRDYLSKGKEVDWRPHQYQPDNVFFSHAAHMPTEDSCGMCHNDEDMGIFNRDNPDYDPNAFCSVCHLSTEELDRQPVKENRLTGYSKTTMKMWECERCHANPNHFGVTNSNNACYTCHK